MSASGEDLSAWSDRIGSALEGLGAPFGRVFVYGSVESTQDAAWRHRCDEGVVVVASRQTAGRGQRGRAWMDGDAATLPMTFGFRCDLDDPGLAARAGLAACDACVDAFRDAEPASRIGIKWPNDVVVRAHDGTPERKLAGVLVERRDGFAFVGVGINVFPVEHDKDRARPAEAASIAGLGGATDRLALAASLARAMGGWLAGGDDAVRARWGALDAMVGTRRAFLDRGVRIDGVVRTLDPLGAIVVGTDGGDRVLRVETARTAPGAGG